MSGRSSRSARSWRSTLKWKKEKHGTFYKSKAASGEWRAVTEP